jgi:hypothetical protein
MEGSLSAQERAIARVAARSEGRGGPIDPALRVTLNFHPDRRVGEVPSCRRWPAMGSTGPSSRPGRATEGLQPTRVAIGGRGRAASSVPPMTRSRLRSGRNTAR